MRAIYIDSNDKRVYEAIIKGNDFREIARLIGCDIIAGGYSFANGDYMYVDDEALLKSNMNGFVIADFDNQQMYDLIGNALIVGSDEDGNDRDALSTIKDIEKIISFHKFI